jgi:hypothetical protein
MRRENRLTDDVLAGVPEHQFGAFVPGQNAPVERFADDGIGRGLDNSGEPGLDLLALLTIMRISVGSHPLQDAAVPVQDRRRMGMEPAVEAIRPLKTQFSVEGLGTSHCIAPLLGDSSGGLRGGRAGDIRC